MKAVSAKRGALFLTAAAALSQVLGFGYRVALARMVGAEVMGLYQLVMPVYSVLLSLTAVGVTSALSNLTAQYLALGNRRGVTQTRGTCVAAFLLLLCPVGAVTVLASDAISVVLLGDARTQLALILLVPCVALTGIENLHKHLFYGAGYVREPAVVELLEQIVRTVAVLGLLWLFLPQYPERAVGLIVGGMVICELFSAGVLLWLYRCRWRRILEGAGESGRIRRRRVGSIAVPVGINALLGNLMGAANASLLPQKLVAGGMERSEALSQLGVVNGMTLPMLALPTVYLGALNLLLIPRIARAGALNRSDEVRRLLNRAVTVVAVLTLPAMGIMAVLGEEVGLLLFRQPIGAYLCPLAAVMGMGCYTSVLMAGLNAVGRQRWVVFVSLLGGVVQVGGTVLLVPRWGIGGYVTGALVSAGLEGVLCLWRLLKVTGLRGDWFGWLVAPGLAAALAALTGNLLLHRLWDLGVSSLPACSGVLLLSGVLYLAALQGQGICLGEVLLGWRQKKKPTVG